MIDKAIVTAMLAHADQHVAQRREDINHLVESYKKLLAQGQSSTVASGLLVLMSMSTLDLVEACQLLGVAVMMVAEAPSQPDLLAGEAPS